MAGRQRQILDAAAAAFHEKGFHGVGVDELGARAGMTGPSLYRHVRGKDEILALLLNQAMDELMPATSPQLEDPAADLERALRHHLAYAVSHRPLVTLYQREVRSLVEPWSTSFAARRGHYTTRWEALVARCLPARPPAEVSALTQACLAAVFSVAAAPRRARATDHLDDVLVGLLLHGLHGARSAT